MCSVSKDDGCLEAPTLENSILELKGLERVAVNPLKPAANNSAMEKGGQLQWKNTGGPAGYVKPSTA